jgi:hypothetical protein
MALLDFKEYCKEFDLWVRYFADESGSIDFEISDADENILMSGKFLTDNYYRSIFQVYASNIEENLYENLFYCYFEYVKLKCIEIYESKEENIFPE